MITPNQSSHWYTPEGLPAYDKTLRDARKETLYPSVTQVIGIISKPMVESWAVNLMSETCYDNPIDARFDGNGLREETLEEYRARIEPEYDKRRKEAAIRGSAIHDFAESWLTSKQAQVVKGYERQCELLVKWCDDNIASATCEESFASNLGPKQGYGGRIDAYGTLKDGRRFVLDFKTQDLKGKSKPNFYETFDWQLSAYKAFLDTHGDNGFNPNPDRYTAFSVVIDTGDIQKIHVKEYTQAETDAAYSTFINILNTWYSIKGL